ncbi:MAG: hypothetical protein ABIH00_03445 [Armatimonadota bacterium]
MGNGQISGIGSVGNVANMYNIFKPPVSLGSGGTAAMKSYVSSGTVDTSTISQEGQKYLRAFKEVRSNIIEIGRPFKEAAKTAGNDLKKDVNSSYLKTINEWLKRNFNGATLNKLKDLSTESLQKINNALRTKAGGLGRMLTDPLVRVKNAVSSEKSIWKIAGHIRKIAAELKMPKSEVWKLVRSNIGKVDSRACTNSQNYNLSVISNVLRNTGGKITGGTLRALSRIDLNSLQNFEKAFLEGVKTQTLTVQQAGRNISSTVMNLGGKEIAIPAMSALVQALHASAGASAGATAAGVTVAAVGGWYIGRGIGNIPIGNGRKVDNAIEDFLKKHKIDGVSYHDTQWGDSAKKYIKDNK